MATFRVGWYGVKTFANGSRFCMLFRDVGHYTAKCRVDANGRQILLWQDTAGPNGPGLPGKWLSTYEFLPNAPAGDWWDNPREGSTRGPENPAAFSRGARKPSVREISQRAAAANAGDASGLCCTKEIHVGLFFDGTNNNMDRDRQDKGHSNVVTLYDSHKDDRKETFAYYLPGVGTRFAEIGEDAESNSDGNAFAKGGEARIHYGMLHVFNAVCTAATGYDLLTTAEMKQLVTSTAGLRTEWRWGDRMMVNIFRGLDARLSIAIRGKRPGITKVNVSVIGFSRGAAQARAFSQWIQQATRGSVGGAVLSFRFLGIFDTVASVLLADSSPVGGDGLMDWANGTMGIAGVERTAHFVAAHEIRRSFPLSTARERGVWPSGVREYVYPGAHSDLGGGYQPGDQGKALGSRTALLSQIPLNDMYHEALNAAVKLRVKSQLPAPIRADFDIDPSLDRAFSAYAAWTIEYDEKQDIAAAGHAPKDRLMYHTHLYWRWRAHVSDDARFRSLHSYANASPQDKVDLWEAELDWRRDVEAAKWAAEPQYDYVPTMNGPVRSATKRSHATPTQRAVLEHIARAADVPQPVYDFFDRFVHDSHAGFWLLGPRTRLDRLQLITEIKDKQREHDRLMQLAADHGNPGRAQNFRNHARAYELNQFERRVLAADRASPGSVPVFSDVDAQDFRSRESLLFRGTLALMGTATRREASGHGRYRQIFDRS